MDTILRTQGANRINQSFVQEAIAGRRAAAERGLDYMLRGLREMQAAGATKEYLSDAASWLSDQISDLIGGMAKDLDDAGLVADGAQIDRTELSKFLADLEPPRCVDPFNPAAVDYEGQ